MPVWSQSGRRSTAVAKTRDTSIDASVTGKRMDETEKTVTTQDGRALTSVCAAAAQPPTAARFALAISVPAGVSLPPSARGSGAVPRIRYSLIR